MTTKNNLVWCNISLIAIMIFFTGVSAGRAAGPGMGPGIAMATDSGRNPEMTRGMANMKWWYNDTLAASMHLTDIQKDALEKSSNKQRLAMIDLQANLLKTRLILETSLDANFTKDASLNYLNDYLAAKNAFEEARMKGLINTREILSEEQYKILKNQISKPDRMRQFRNQKQGMRSRMDRSRM